MLMLNIYNFLWNIWHWQIMEMSAQTPNLPKILRFVDVLHKRSKSCTYECPSQIAVLIERLSSSGSWGSVGSIPMPDRTVFMYIESV